ncbi:hypothetical protein EJB05_54563, partial [Eragrostis curvula]
MAMPTAGLAAVNFLTALEMEALLGSTSNGGGKATDLARLLVAEAALEVQRSLVAFAALANSCIVLKEGYCNMQPLNKLAHVMSDKFVSVLMLSLQNEFFTSGGEQDLINRILGKNKYEVVPENKDDGESDDDNDEEGGDEDAENQDDEDEAGGEEDGSDEEGNEEDDDDDDPAANGEGGSDDDDDDDDGGEDDDDDDGDDDGEDDDEGEGEEEEEEEDDDDDIPQPPTKKRK